MNIFIEMLFNISYVQEAVVTTHWSCSFDLEAIKIVKRKLFKIGKCINFLHGPSCSWEIFPFYLILTAVLR
jgi:hypothetical protein